MRSRAFARAVGFAGGLGVLALSPVARADGAPASGPTAPAPTAHPEATTYAAAGASVFTLAYLASALGATTGFDDVASVDTARGALWVPVVGPFVTIGTARPPAGIAALYAADGFVQAAALTSLILGVVWRTEALQRQHAPHGATSLTLAPALGPGVAGACVAVMF